MSIWRKVKQIMCHHQFISGTTKCKYDGDTHTFRITETCFKCGKKFSFTASEKAFGLEE